MNRQMTNACPQSHGLVYGFIRKDRYWYWERRQLIFLESLAVIKYTTLYLDNIDLFLFWDDVLSSGKDHGGQIGRCFAENINYTFF